MQNFTVVETFAQFIGATNDYYYMVASKPPVSWRAGQTAFNLLTKIRPDIAELIRGSDFDPFHNDANLLAFYDFVQRHWKDAH